MIKKFLNGMFVTLAIVFMIGLVSVIPQQAMAYALILIALRLHGVKLYE